MPCDYVEFMSEEDYDWEEIGIVYREAPNSSSICSYAQTFDANANF
jgi:hypothetical protein